MQFGAGRVGISVALALASGSAYAACQPSAYKVVEVQPLSAYLQTVPDNFPSILFIGIKNGGKTEMVRVGRSIEKTISPELYAALLAEIGDGDNEKIKVCYQRADAASESRPMVMYHEIGEITIEGNVWSGSALLR